MSGLHTVTITGADDGVDPMRLVELSEQYPFVEWGILLSSRRAGEQRYPSPAWQTDLAIRTSCAKPTVRVSAHLCGDLAREAMGGSLRWWKRLQFHPKRVQLNGWSSYELPTLRIAKKLPGLEFIAQATGPQVFRDAHDFVERDQWSNVSVLYDRSGGRGVFVETIEFAPLASVRSGFAGGINGENVQSTLDALGRLTTPFWIDMESGVRTDDRFDLRKVIAVLERCRPYVGAAA